MTARDQAEAAFVDAGVSPGFDKPKVKRCSYPDCRVYTIRDRCEFHRRLTAEADGWASAMNDLALTKGKTE